MSDDNDDNDDNDNIDENNEDDDNDDIDNIDENNEDDDNDENTDNNDTSAKHAMALWNYSDGTKLSYFWIHPVHFPEYI